MMRTLWVLVLALTLGACVASTYADRDESAAAPSGQEVYVIRHLQKASGDDPALNTFAERRPRFNRRQGWRDRRLYVASIQRAPDGRWETARVLEPRRRQGTPAGLIFQTLVTFAVLIAVLFF